MMETGGETKALSEVGNAVALTGSMPVYDALADVGSHRVVWDIKKYGTARESLCRILNGVCKLSAYFCVNSNTKFSVVSAGILLTSLSTSLYASISEILVKEIL